MMIMRVVGLACAAVVCACGSDSSTSLGDAGSAGDGGDAGGSIADAASTADGGVPLANCAAPCGANEVCVRPGACDLDARCVARSEITCPDAGLCYTTGCAGELSGNVFTCTCR